MHVFKNEARAMQEQLVQWRRWCHQHPGLGFQVRETAEFIAKLLRQWNLEVETEVGRSGVVGIVRGGRPGPVVAVRVDIDALPIQEENTHAFISAYPGKMHACGHDGHIAIGLGVARLLSQHRQDLSGTAVIIFQPGEEGYWGAREMIKDGVLSRHQVQAIVGGHIGFFSPELALGEVGISYGPIMAAGCKFEAEVIGKGGHGAQPQDAIDPIAVTAEVISAWQRIVSREVSPLTPAVLSLGEIHGGQAYNIIPERVSLSGTIRFFHDQAGELLFKRVEEVLAGICRTWRAKYTFKLHPGYPAVINDPDFTVFFAGIARKVTGEEKVKVLEFPIMVSEDMSFYLQKVPGTYFLLGAGNPAENYPHHHPRFDFNEEVLWLGAALLAQTAWEYGKGFAAKQTE